MAMALPCIFQSLPCLPKHSNKIVFSSVHLKDWRKGWLIQPLCLDHAPIARASPNRPTVSHKHNRSSRKLSTYHMRMLQKPQPLSSTDTYIGQGSMHWPCQAYHWCRHDARWRHLPARVHQHAFTAETPLCHAAKTRHRWCCRCHAPPWPRCCASSSRR
jgi:hypothetical protein